MGWFTKKKSGEYVYVAESTRRDGSKKIYTGMTRRSPKVRWGEHMSGNGGKWTSNGKYFKPLGAVWSSNPRKAEQTVKRMNPQQKRVFGRIAAYKYNKRRWD